MMFLFGIVSCCIFVCLFMALYGDIIYDLGYEDERIRNAFLVMAAVVVPVCIIVGVMTYDISAIIVMVIEVTIVVVACVKTFVKKTGV